MDNQAQNIAHFQDYLGEGSLPLMRGLQLALNLQAELASLPLSKLEEANKPAFTQSLLASLLNIVSSLNDGIHKLSSPPLQLPRQSLPLKKRSYEHVCRRSSSSPARITTKNCTKQAPEKIVRRSLAKSKHKVHAVKDLADGFTWRKYGQKNIQGFTHPRSYYRCIHRGDLNCPALKQVQECDGIASTFDIAYIENHTCCKGACEDQPYGNASKSNSSYGAAPSCLQIVPTNSCTSSSAAVKEETTTLDISKTKWEEVVQDSGFTRSLLCSLMLAEQAENKSSNLPQLAHEQQDQEISCTNNDLPLWDFEAFPAFVDFEGQL